MGFSEEFFATVSDARAPFVALAAQIRDMRAFVPRWFLTSFHAIRATVPTLRFALRRTHATTEFMGELRRFYNLKLCEEGGHVDLLRSDLMKMGVEFEETAPLAPIADMMGRQFYLIHFLHPSAYLGYIGLLEGFQPSLPQVDALREASGYPEDAFSCARLHATADQAHKKELAKFLDEVPPRFRRCIVVNAVRCVELQAQALTIILEECKNV